MKETIHKAKRQPSEWEKIMGNETTDKELISKIYTHSCSSIPEYFLFNQKMSRRPKQRFLQKRHIDG